MIISSGNSDSRVRSGPLLGRLGSGQRHKSSAVGRTSTTSPTEPTGPSHTFVVGLVNSPLQSLNVLEACRTLDLTPNLMLIAKESWSARSIPQIIAVIECMAGASVGPKYDVSDYVLSLLTIRSARRAMKRAKSMINQSSEGGSITLIVGNFTHAFWWALANQLRGNLVRVVVVDDGIGSLHIDRVNQSRWRTRDFVKGLVFRSLGFDERPRFQITFCSAYDLTGKLLPTDRSVANERPMLRALAREVTDVTPYPIVIGSPVADALDSGLLVEDDIDLALRQLRFATRSHGGPRAVYVPHHKERPEKLAAIAEYFDVTEAKLPVEVAATLSRQAPSSVVGLPSTAFKNLIELFPGRVKVGLLQLPDHLISESMRPVYNSLYEYHVREFPHEVKIIPPSVWMADEN